MAEVIEHEVFKAPGGRHRHGDVHLDDSIRDFARGVVELWADAELSGLPIDQEHDPESL